MPNSLRKSARSDFGEVCQRNAASQRKSARSAGEMPHLSVNLRDLREKMPHTVGEQRNRQDRL